MAKKLDIKLAEAFKRIQRMTDGIRQSTRSELIENYAIRIEEIIAEYVEQGKFTGFKD